MNADNEALPNFEVLKNKLLNEKQIPNEAPAREAAVADDAVETEEPSQKETKVEKQIRKFLFQKGDSKIELDEDAEIEIKVDKQPTKIKLRELTERASGDIAVKKRMHEVAEMKKKVTGTFKEFSHMAKENPFKALEYIASRAKEADEDFNFKNYLLALGDQVEKLEKMTPSEREASQLKEKLKDVEGQLTRQETQAVLDLRADQIMGDYGITEDQFDSYVRAVVGTPELIEDIVDEQDILDRVELFAVEMRNQKAAYEAIQEFQPNIRHNDPMVLSIAQVLRTNAELTGDFNKEDIKEIVEGLLQQDKRKKTQSRLSYKARQSQNVNELSGRNLTEFEILAQKLKEEKERERELTLRW